MARFTMRSGMLRAIVFLLAGFFSLPSFAQTPTYQLGRPPTPEEVRAWDISIGPAGTELPAGSGTAKLGAPIYARKCAVCHGATGREVMPAGPRVPLVGGEGTHATPNPVRSVGSYWAFATTIWDVINRAMPVGNQGTLTPEEVYALSALVLYWNGIIEETDVIDATTLPKIEMPNRNGFIPPKLEDINRLRCRIGTCP